MKKVFCCPALELFYCLPLWKTVLFVSSRAFSLSTPTFSLSTPVENSEATWKKATKCNKDNCFTNPLFILYDHIMELKYVGIFINLSRLGGLKMIKCVP